MAGTMTEFQMKLFKDTQGVYVLISNGIPVYVGCSDDIYVRIHHHRYESDKVFDKAFHVRDSWVEGNMLHTLSMEMAFICYYQCEYNKIKFDSFTYWYLSLPSNNGTNTSILFDEIEKYKARVLNANNLMSSKNLIEGLSNEY